MPSSFVAVAINEQRSNHNLNLIDHEPYGSAATRHAGIFMAFMTNAKLQVFALIGFAYFSSFDVAVATEIAGRASVIDADTIEIHGQRIRLHGVDAPEKGQECFQPDGLPWRCGQRGALALADFIGESPVSCRSIDTDRYGRVVANCHVRGRDIEEWLVSEGWAMAYRRYSSHYIGAEQAAKNGKRGIWAGTVQPPWEWRRDRRR